jgi:hypothetical protein
MTYTTVSPAKRNRFSIFTIALGSSVLASGGEVTAAWKLAHRASRFLYKGIPDEASRPYAQLLHTFSPLQLLPRSVHGSWPRRALPALHPKMQNLEETNQRYASDVQSGRFTRFSYWNVVRVVLRIGIVMWCCRWHFLEPPILRTTFEAAGPAGPPRRSAGQLIRW